MLAGLNEEGVICIIAEDEEETLRLNELCGDQLRVAIVGSMPMGDQDGFAYMFVHDGDILVEEDDDDD